MEIKFDVKNKVVFLFLAGLLTVVFGLDIVLRIFDIKEGSNVNVIKQLSGVMEIQKKIDAINERFDSMLVGRTGSFIKEVEKGNAEIKDIPKKSGVSFWFAEVLKDDKLVEKMKKLYGVETMRKIQLLYRTNSV